MKLNSKKSINRNFVYNIVTNLYFPTIENYFDKDHHNEVMTLLVNGIYHSYTNSIEKEIKIKDFHKFKFKHHSRNYYCEVSILTGSFNIYKKIV